MEKEESLENVCSSSKQPITELFRRAGTDKVLADELFRTLQTHFRRVSRAKKRRLNVGDSLPTDQIAADGFLKLLRRHPEQWNNREHILRTAALAMEQVVRNHRRKKRTAKSGGLAKTVTLAGSDVSDPVSVESDDEAAVHDALERLSESKPKFAVIVRLKHFGDLSHRQIAQEMELTEDQVSYKYQQSLAWLSRELNREQG